MYRQNANEQAIKIKLIVFTFGPCLPGYPGNPGTPSFPKVKIIIIIIIITSK